jgi:tetratricopeptide (TPR) repeat protein
MADRGASGTADPAVAVPGGAPTVGNVLGFSLLLRDRKALLHLDARMVGGGVRLSDYEAEIPGVEFPLATPLSPLRYRHRRCLARGLALTIERRTLAATVRERLVGAELDRVIVQDAVLHLSTRLAPSEPALPCLYVHTSDAGAHGLLLAALRVRPIGRRLAVEPVRLWGIGAGLHDPEEQWRRIARRLVSPGARSEELVFDPAREALLRSFVGAGWKAPDLGGLRIAGLSVSAERLSLRLAAVETAEAAAAIPGVNLPLSDPIGERIESIHDALAAHDLDAATRGQQELADALMHHDASRLAALRWLAQTAAARQPRRSLDALRTWVHLQPRDRAAERTLLTRLWTTGAHRELAARVAAACRLPNPPAEQARLELSLACIFVDHLRDPAGARALLLPLLRRLADQPGLEAVRSDALSCLARATAHDASAALEVLRMALELEPRPAVAASMRASVGRALGAAGHSAEALPLLREALRGAPDDEPTHAVALELAEALGDLGAIRELVEGAAHRSDATVRRELRRRVIAWLGTRTDPEALALLAETVHAALDEEPDAPDLLDRLAQIEHRRGDPSGAAQVLGRLAERSDDPDERVQLRMRRARLLAEAGDEAQAWATLEPALDEVAGALEVPLLVAALEVAPSGSIEDVVDRLVAIDAGDAGGRALLSRAARVPSPNQRRRDLQRAAELLDDPREALGQLASLAAPDRTEPWAALADACAEQRDTEGEHRARIELALRYLASDAVGPARDALRRACQLRPRPATALLYGLAEARAGDLERAAELLRPFAVADLPAGEMSPLDDPRVGIDARPQALPLLLGRILEDAGAIEPARDALRRAEVHLVDPHRRVRVREKIAALSAALGDPGADEDFAAVALLHEGPEAAAWHLRAAQHAPRERAATYLRRAQAILPGSPDVLRALEDHARRHQDDAMLEDVLAQRATAGDTARRVAARRELLARRRKVDGDDAPGTVAAAREVLALDASQTEAAEIVAADLDRRGDTNEAERWWRVAFAALDEGDPRIARLAARLSARARRAGEPRGAIEVLERALASAPTLELFEELDAVATVLDEDALRLRAAEGRRALAADDDARARADLDLARLFARRGDVRAALDRLAAAASWAAPGSTTHLAAAEERLRLVEREQLGPEAEAAARAELRRASRGDVPTPARRTEIQLLVELGRGVDALAVLLDGLERAPTDALLLSELKPLASATGRAEVYVEALERALDDVLPTEQRDRLALELAMAAAAIGDAHGVLRAIEHASAAAGGTDEMLDMWDWAVVALGREGAELGRIDERLRRTAADEPTLRRLQRRLDDPPSFVEHLLQIAAHRDGPAHDLLRPAISIAARLHDIALLLRAVRTSIGHGATDLVAGVWNDLEDTIVRSADEVAIADLVQLADDSGDAELSQRAGELLDAALAWIPQAPPLHRALWARVDGSDDEKRSANALAHVEMLAESADLGQADRALLVVGIARQLPRRRAVELLARRAEAALAEPDAFKVLVQALEQDGHWPEALRLHEMRAAAATDDAERVAVFKHLAHIASDTLGDPSAAVHHLETALALAPHDPDLLLPLLDHHFARKDLARAVELSFVVLEHVAMGSAAFTALGHRAADAAVARDEPDVAARLLSLVADRVPADVRAKERIVELDRVAGDPARRVGVLAAVADRQTGNARFEALEERARLLVDPLERIEEAIADLRVVVEEAPGRAVAAELLEELYRRTAQWQPLVVLLGESLQRRHGSARAETLAEIGAIHRDALGDPARAEEAVRTAIEQIDREADAPLWDRLSLDLADVLARQQRWPDLARHLEAWLAPDFDAEAEPPSPVRIEQMRRLAEIHRDRLDDQASAARVYERLLELDAIPDDGLAELARWFYRERRHRDLVRVLELRAQALVGEAQAERRAAVELRIAELLEGPLGRPHEAAPHYLEAYLADPETHAPAGARARVLLSGTDSVVNVRRRLRERLGSLPASRRPALLTLLADVLAPQEGWEDEAEAYYRKALELDDGAGAASEGLGRLLVRRGRLEEGAAALLSAARSDVVPPARAADCAAAAARQLMELQRFDDAERALKTGLRRMQKSQRALLELARLYERTGRHEEQAAVLERLSAEPLSIALQAEVAYRRALLLRAAAEPAPRGPEAERARALLLEAVGADPTHAGARQALIELAARAGDWTIVAHMQFLAVRDLPPGPQRAKAHLDLAQTYLDRIDDAEAAMRNLESAVHQAGDDVVVVGRAAELARRMPAPLEAAERFEAIAGAQGELPEAARARLWLLAADLRMAHDDEPVTLEEVEHGRPPEDASLATRREEAARIVARLDARPTADVRVQLVGTLHELAVALGDASLRERAEDEERAIAAVLAGRAPSDSGTSMLRELISGGDAYDAVVSLHERLAERARAEDPVGAAALLVEGSRVAWSGLGRFAAAAQMLARAADLHWDERTEAALVDVVSASADTEEAALVLAAARGHAGRSPRLALALARLALAVGDETTATSLAAPFAEPDIDPELRFAALGVLDAVLARRGENDPRLDGLEQRFTLAMAHEAPALGDIAVELARLQHRLGHPAAARRTCALALARTPDHRGLLRMYAQLLETEGSYAELVTIDERLAEVSADDDERAAWLTRAAEILVAHPEACEDGDPTDAARRRLRRAVALAPRSAAPRLQLLPLSFVQGRFAEVLELAGELLAIGETRHDALALAALAEAYEHGRRDLASRLGSDGDASAIARTLVPALDHVLELVARRGPLPRLDAVLSSAATLCGGRGPLLTAIVEHTAAHRLRAGTALAIARLHESRGAADPARHHYQLAAVLAPRGPVPRLVARLPAAPLHLRVEEAAAAPLDAHRPLRAALMLLRDGLAAIEARPGPERSSPPMGLATVLERAEEIVGPWRERLGVPLPIGWVDGPDPHGVGIRNAAVPTIVLTPPSRGLGEPELQFRLADAAAGIVMGLAVLESSTFDLGDLLEAVRQSVNPMIRSTRPGGRHLADALAERGTSLLEMPLEDRADVVHETSHVLATSAALARLSSELQRGRRLFATRLSGRLDGALFALARQIPRSTVGGRPERLDGRALLEAPDVQWLLHGLGLR